MQARAPCTRRSHHTVPFLSALPPLIRGTDQPGDGLCLDGQVGLLDCGCCPPVAVSLDRLALAENRLNVSMYVAASRSILVACNPDVVYGHSLEKRCEDRLRYRVADSTSDSPSRRVKIEQRPLRLKPRDPCTSFVRCDTELEGGGKAAKAYRRL